MTTILVSNCEVDFLLLFSTVSIINLLSIPRGGVHTTLLRTVSALLPPQYGTHSLLAFALVLYHTHSVVFL